MELANTAVCRKCHKSEEQTKFSKSQQKRSRKGQEAICKVCREQEDGAASSSSAGAKDVQPRAGKAVSRLCIHNARIHAPTAIVLQNLTMPHKTMCRPKTRLNLTHPVPL